MASDTHTFHWLDYVLFVASLLVAAGIGSYFGLKGKKQTSTKSFLLGGGKMHPLPVALSLQASFMSAVQILGNTSEIYLNGTMYAYIVLGYCWCFPVAAYVFMPVIHRLNITTAYEYLEKRFNRNVRMMASCIFVFMMVIYLGLALYTPAIALSQVTGLSKWISIMGIGLVCTFYTSIGGMKAVVYTDFIQVVIIYTALIMLMVEGAVQVGGLGEVWNIAEQGHRIQFDTFSAHPHERHTFWTQLIGGGTMTLTLYGANQAMIQRYLSMKTVRAARTSIFISLGSTIITQILLVLLGLIMFAYYYTCDPLTAGKVDKSDQLLIYMMMDALGHLHGLPGVFTASIFSAALSTVSSGVNALAAVMLVDIIKPTHIKYYHTTMSDAKATVVSKLLALGFGLSSIAVAYIAEHLGSRVLQFTLSIFGVVGGPLLGLFICGMLLPCVNSLGALIGTLINERLVFTFWVQFGYILGDYTITTLPLRTDGCYGNQTTTQSPMTSHTDIYQHTYDITDAGSSGGLDDLYAVSYMWYSVMAVVVNVVTAVIVSALTGCTKDEPPTDDLLFTTRCRPTQHTEESSNQSDDLTDIGEGDIPDMNSKTNLVDKERRRHYRPELEADVAAVVNNEHCDTSL